MRPAHRTTALALLATLLVLGGCDLATQEREAKAAREAQAAQEHTELRDATRREDLRQRAADANKPVEEHNKRQEDAIRDAGG